MINIIVFYLIIDVSIDISTLSPISIFNSKLICNYIKCQPSFLNIGINFFILGKFIKAWGKTHHIIESKQGGFNSYTMIIMLIYSLQVLLNILES